jgi:multimeric flavodoxin WrbA
VNGSPHPSGVVAELLELVLGGAREAGAATDVLNLYGLRITHEPGFYSEDPRREVPAAMPGDDIVRRYPDIVRADGLVLATPVYWANMSGIMKDFLDHLTALENDGFQLEGKAAAFIAASKENEGGVEMAAMAMVTALAQMGVLIPPNAVMWYPGKWVTAERPLDAWARDDAPKVGRNMVQLVRLLREHPIDWGSAASDRTELLP